MARESESKTKQIVDAAGDVLVEEAANAGFELAFRALTDALSYACEVAADCGETALKVTCEVAGHALDGI